MENQYQRKNESLVILYVFIEYNTFLEITNESPKSSLH